MRFVSALLVFVLSLGFLSFSAKAQGKNDDKKDKAITLAQIGRYSAGSGGVRAEIAAYDPDTKKIFAVNLALLRVDVLEISDPDTPVLEFMIPLAGTPNSVAIRDGVVAVAIENAVKTNSGFVQLFTSNKLSHRREIRDHHFPDLQKQSPCHGSRSCSHGVVLKLSTIYPRLLRRILWS